jgi:Fe-S cluster biogenesis protein NfuA
MDELWKKYAPTKFTGKTKEDRATEVLSLSDNAKNVIENALKIEAKDSTQVQNVFNEAKEKINFDSKLNSEQKAELVEHLRSKVYTTHGTRSEDKTSDKVEADEGSRLVRDDKFTGKTKEDRATEVLSLSDNAKNVIENALKIEAKDSTQVQNVFNEAKEKINFDSKLNSEQKADEGSRLVRDDKFHQFEVCVIDDVKYVIVGKVDRIEERPDGSRVLVEIKNRTNRLFRSVPEYEFIQIQVYLQMLGLVHARLIEQYNNQVLSHEVTRDEEMWINEILPELEKFCQDLHLKII